MVESPGHAYMKKRMEKAGLARLSKLSLTPFLDTFFNTFFRPSPPLEIAPDTFLVSLAFRAVQYLI